MPFPSIVLDRLSASICSVDSWVPRATGTAHRPTLDFQSGFDGDGIGLNKERFKQRNSRRCTDLAPAQSPASARASIWATAPGTTLPPPRQPPKAQGQGGQG